jgi:hypothetical protein
VEIYNGNAFFNPGDTVASFSWYGKVFSGSADLTPLLFQSNGDGTFTVEAIGAGIVVTGATDASVQSVSFGLQAGSLVAGTNYTFGFVSGLVGSDGTVTGTPGSVSLNNGVDGGTGVSGGSSTNDWVFTPNTETPTVQIGTTFGANGTYALNNPAGGGFNVDRTYSAQANANASGVAEPGTFSLITGAGLVLAGLFRYRYSRGRRS